MGLVKRGLPRGWELTTSLADLPSEKAITHLASTSIDVALAGRQLLRLKTEQG